MSSPSSATMCTSTDDCFCQEHVRQRRSPNSSYVARISSSAVSCSALWGTDSSLSPEDLSLCSEDRLGGAKQHLLQRVRAQAAAQRLERDRLVRRDVPEVDGRAEL